MFRADMHCHSTCSDGTLTPKELVQLAKESHLQGLSITDHDTVAAYTPELLAFAQELGIHLVSGVELSAVHKTVSVHILGYNFSIEQMVPLCEKHLVRRRERNEKILAKLKEKGMHIDTASLTGEGRPHIAKQLVLQGYAKDIQEAFSLFIGEGKPCYAKGMPFTAHEAIQHIKAAGGRAFLAHPHLIKRRSVRDSLLTLPFDGIECYYSLMPAYRESTWLSLAKSKKWLISGGSDFHGSIRPGVPLGSSWVDQSAFERITSRE